MHFEERGWGDLVALCTIDFYKGIKTSDSQLNEPPPKFIGQLLNLSAGVVSVRVSVSVCGCASE